MKWIEIILCRITDDELLESLADWIKMRKPIINWKYKQQWKNKSEETSLPKVNWELARNREYERKGKYTLEDSQILLYDLYEGMEDRETNDVINQNEKHENSGGNRLLRNCFL
jgi:hypothetical protein